MYVANLRHIQSIHETPERRNPDTLVRQFIPMLQRLRTARLGQAELSKLRSDPFYYYLIARTRYYDQVVEGAVADGVERMVGVGCGSDTRAYRFQQLLCSKGVKVLECDQREAIQVKQRLVRRWRFDHVEHMAIDLNDSKWPELECWLGKGAKPKSLVLMEGVSPYVDASAFRDFLLFLATRLAPGSEVAYDFKISGVKDDFGADGRTQTPFRLSADRDEVGSFHEALGLDLDHMELSSELAPRLLPGLDESARPLFSEDGLVRLRVKETNRKLGM